MNVSATESDRPPLLSEAALSNLSEQYRMRTSAGSDGVSYSNELMRPKKPSFCIREPRLGARHID